MSSMVAKTINVIKNSSNKGDTTDIALMVSTSSKAEINPWDKSKIVNSLIIETGATTELAQEIAEAVEQKILDSNLKNVTTSIIRELIDIELIEQDLPMMHKRHSHLGLPMYDVEQIIFNANKENSNTTHNPESINLTLAEALLKEYALRKVFAEDVAQAHMIGDIHLHDLGFIVRPYTYMGDSVVLVKRKGDFEKLVSIKQFYDELPFEFQAEEGVWIKQPISDLYVVDRGGRWTKVIQLTKKEKKNKQMYFVRTSDGKQQVVTHDHPMITTEGIKPCGLLRKGDRLITQDYQFKNYGIASINLVEEFAAAGVSGERYNVYLGQKIPLRVVKKDIYQGNANPEHYEGAVLTLTKGASKERAAEQPLTSELGWVLGFYIAEGHQSEHSIAFTCRGEGKAKLLENLRILNIPYEQKKRADRIVINDILIRDLFINVWKVGEKAREKSLPPDIIHYSVDFIKGVVAGIIDGDGSIDNASIYIRVSSAILVNQLTYVLKMLGFEPSGRKPQGVGSMREYNGRQIVQRYPIWCLAFGKKADIDLPSFKYERTSVAPNGPVARQAGIVEVTHVEPVDIPDEYIYDITTESHTFVCNGIYSHNCGGHSLEYIKKYGLALPNITSVSKPAKHPEVLIGHMVKMASTLQSHYAGAVGWEAVNIFFAPYIVNLPYDEVKQLAQMLIFEFNQLAGSRGAQVTFTDFNLYYGIPRHFENTPALGPGGKYMKRKEGRIVYYDEPVDGCLTYKDFEKEANLFLKALFDVYLEGDVTGKTFVFPKPLLHINEKFFETPGHDEFLDFACQVASKQGITYFVFDRGDSATVSQCCRLRLRLGEKDLEETKTPEKMRFSALQNVTVNLPRIAYKARGNDELLFTELNRTLDLVARAHVSKKEFISDLIELKERGPLYMFSATQDGSQYLRMDRLTYLCGLLGLNEMVQAHLGEQLHESDRALKFGLKIVSYMNLKCRQLSERYGIRMILEESPAESAAYRLAKLDMKYFPEQTSNVIKGRLEGENYYYTNSIHLAYDAPVDFIERVEKQSLFHPLVEAGSICLSPEQKLLTFKDGKTDVLSVEQLARNYLPSDRGEKISSALTSRINLTTLGADLPANKSLFTKIKAITKVPISGRRIVEVRSSGNKAVRVTADHPVPVLRKGEIIDIPAINLTRKDTLLIASKVKRKTPSHYCLFNELLSYAEQIFVADVNSVVKSYLKNKGLLTDSLRQIHKGSLRFQKVLELVPIKQLKQWAKKNLIMWKMENSTDRLPFTLSVDENLGHFFGFMLSEGHKHSKNSGALKRGLYNVGATFSCDEKEYQDLFRKAVKESFGLKMHRSTENGSHTTISIGSKSLHFLLTNILDIGERALSRRIPEQLYSFGDRFLLSMIDAMFAGDGTSTKNYITYNTRSEKLKSGLGLVCALLGIRVAYWKQGIAILRDEAVRLQSSMPLFAAKSFLGAKRRPVTNGAWLTTESTPFSYLHFKYAQQGLGRALEPVRRGRLYRAKAYKKIIATSTALKYARNWIHGLSALLKMEDLILCRVLRKEDIAMAVGASSDYVRHVLGGREDSLQYEHAWSSKKEILSSVHLFAEEIRNDIARDIDKLKKFTKLLKSDISFEPLKSVEIVENTPPYVYDLTTECGLFAVASGILLHNCHIWLGESEPNPQGIKNFVLKTFRNTQAEQIAFSPEFTVCEACRRTTRGLQDTCSLCGSDKVYGITRIVGYFSKIPTWNKGKASELKDRVRTDLSEVV